MKFKLEGCPFTCEVNGARGYSCPALKLYGYSSERALKGVIDRTLALPRETLARRGVFLPIAANA